MKIKKSIVHSTQQVLHLIHMISLLSSLEFQCLPKVLEILIILAIPDLASAFLSDSFHAISPYSFTTHQSH